MEAEAVGLPSNTLTVWLVVLALPLLLTLTTAFTKASVVLGALRVGLSAEALLPMPVLLGVALVITGIVMTPVVAPTLDAIEAAGGIGALLEGGADRWLEVLAPWRDFLRRHASADELSFFAELQARSPDDPLVLVAAFLTTELGEALAMAVVVLVPFVIVDLLAAQALALIGSTGPGTQLVTIPLKLLLFLSVGGFDIIVGGLVEGYR